MSTAPAASGGGSSNGEPGSGTPALAPASNLDFPGKLTRTISLAMAGIIVSVLIVGGISLFLALQIHHINDAVDREYEHILSVDRYQSSFQEVITALYSMHVRENPQRLTEVEAVYAELTHRLDSFRALHASDPDYPEDPSERTAFAQIEACAQSLRHIITRLGTMPAGRQRLDSADLDQLGLASQQLPRLTAQSTQAHATRVTRLLDLSQRKMRTIGYLYVAFLAVSAGLIGISAHLGWRKLTTPLRRLALAASAIAERRPSLPVPVETANEIGQVSRAFNTMAEQLRARDQAVQATQEQLEHRVQELASLFRLGTQIGGLHDLDQILGAVADAARELLHADAVVILLLDPKQNALTVRALSGPPNAFQPWVRLKKPIALVDALDAEAQHRQVLWPEFLRAHLSAMLTRGGNALGVICVTSRSSREYAAADQEILSALATQASIAVENAQLSEETRSLGIREERDRLAREMQDGLAQHLATLHLRLQRIHEQAPTVGAEAVAAELGELISLADHACDEARQSIFGLRIPGTRGLGLIPTLSDYLQQFSAQTGLPVSLDVPNEYAIRLSSSAEVQVIRIVQEALANVRKHARATQAWVRLSGHEAYVQAAIEDDGQGFDPALLEGNGHQHIGLQSMQERAASVGGGLRVDTTPGRGTRVTAWLPIQV